MEFAKKKGAAADAMASLALISSMLNKLNENGIISDQDVKAIKEWAKEQIPADNVEKNQEARSLIDTI